MVLLMNLVTLFQYLLGYLSFTQNIYMMIQ